MKRERGVWVINLRTAIVFACSRFDERVLEDFFAEVSANIKFPDLVNNNPEIIGMSYRLDDAVFGQVPCELQEIEKPPILTNRNIFKSQISAQLLYPKWFIAAVQA